MTDIEIIERKLMQYSIIQKRVESLVKEGERLDLLQIALKLGPKDAEGSDLTLPRVQHAAPQGWIYNFGKACDQLLGKTEQLSGEIADCAKKQIEIRMMVERANLDEDEKLYCELRYFKGLRHSEIGNAEYLDVGRSKLTELRKKALKKISAANLY